MLEYQSNNENFLGAGWSHEFNFVLTVSNICLECVNCFDFVFHISWRISDIRSLRSFSQHCYNALISDDRCCRARLTNLIPKVLSNFCTYLKILSSLDKIKFHAKETLNEVYGGDFNCSKMK